MNIFHTECLYRNVQAKLEEKPYNRFSILLDFFIYFIKKHNLNLNIFLEKRIPNISSLLRVKFNILLQSCHSKLQSSKIRHLSMSVAIWDVCNLPNTYGLRFVILVFYRERRVMQETKIAFFSSSRVSLLSVITGVFLSCNSNTNI